MADDLSEPDGSLGVSNSLTTVFARRDARRHNAGGNPAGG